jgi:hypothetical protein
LRNVDVDGFLDGISTESAWLTAEELAVHHQRHAGLFLRETDAAIRHLTGQEDEAPAIVGNKSLCLTNAYLGGRAEAAIVWKGACFARDVGTEAYRNALEYDGELIAGPALDDYLPKVTTLFETPKKSFDLPLEKMPVFESSDGGDWVSAKSLGAAGDGKRDDTVEIQKAIDSGKAIVYLPHGTYRISKAIELRGSLKRLVGMGSKIDSINVLEPRFRLADGKSSDVLVDQIEIFGERGVAFEQASARTLSLRAVDTECLLHRSTVREPTVFLEDVRTHRFKFEKASIIARHFRTTPEPPRILRVKYDPPPSCRAEFEGGVFACLGFCTHRLIVSNGARGELIGSAVPWVELTDSSLAIISAEPTGVTETQRSVRRSGKIDGPYVGRRRD